MDKRKISAKELVSDIKSGMTDAQLMAKHELTPKALEGLFSKLIQAGVLNASAIRERGVVKKGPTPGVFEGDADPKPAVSDEQRPAELLKAIADEVKSGVHDSEIMRRHELSPGKLKQIKNELVQLGYLAAEQVQRAETKKTKLCPFCSREIQQSAAKCVHCEQWLNTPEAGGPPGAFQPGVGVSLPRPQFDEAYDDEDERECPWDDRASYGTLNAYFATASKCLLHPTQFFSKLPKDAGYLNPILFGVMTIVLSVVFAFIWSSLLSRGGGLFVFLIGIPFIVLGSFIMIPIVLFVGSGILHLCLLLVRGANEGYQATFRVVSYSSVPSLFNAVPIVGSIASLWSIVLTVIGLREIHKTSTGKSVAAVLIPVGIVVVLAVVAALAAFSAGGSAFTGMPLLSAFSRSPTLPSDVCTALEDYVAKIDALKEQDLAAAGTQVQAAVQELDDVLNQFRSDKGVAQIRKVATAYGMGTVTQMRLKKTMGGKMDLSKMEHALGTQRDALLQMCGK